MSLRPSERTDARKSNYKVAVDAAEARRRREDQMVEIRRKTRDESLQKKRREGFAAASQLTHSSALQQKVCALPRRALIWSVTLGFGCGRASI
jgi:importin subunit alpha-6/7